MRIVLFTLSVVGPFIKVRILGSVTDLDTQLLYVSYYFAVQFVTPLIDCGASWSSIRQHLENKEKFVLFFTPLGALAGLAISAVSMEYGLVILISVTMAFFNYHLQVFRLLGRSILFYICKISRLVLDLSLLFLVLIATQYTDETLLQFILAGELVSILVVVFIISWNSPPSISYKFQAIFFANTKDFTFIAIKIVRANFLRLVSPMMFSNLQFVKFFYLLLLYELIVQFVNAEYLRQIVDRGINYKYAFCAWVASAPLQFAGMAIFSQFMAWEFSFFEYACVCLIGSTTIYSVFSFRLIALGAYSKFRNLVLLDIVSKTVIFVTLYALEATYNQILGGILLNYAIWFVGFYSIHRRSEAGKFDLAKNS